MIIKRKAQAGLLYNPQDAWDSLQDALLKLERLCMREDNRAVQDSLDFHDRNDTRWILRLIKHYEKYFCFLTSERANQASHKITVYMKVITISSNNHFE